MLFTMPNNTACYGKKIGFVLDRGYFSKDNIKQYE